MKIDLNTREIALINEELIKLIEKRKSEINSELEKAFERLPDANTCKHERYRIPIMKSNFLSRSSPKSVYDFIFRGDNITFIFRKVKGISSYEWEFEDYE